MRNLFFLLLVVFSLWTIIFAAVTIRQQGQVSELKRKPAQQQIAAAVSFSAAKSSQSNCPEQPPCAAKYKAEIKKYSAKGCPLWRCVKIKPKCPEKPQCNSNQMIYYSGDTLPNGCQVITCKNRQSPRRNQRKNLGQCPSVSSSSCKKNLNQGECLVPKRSFIRGRWCPVCPTVKLCSEPPKQKCRRLNCPRVRPGQCVIPNKDDSNGCKRCPIITATCNHVSGGDTLG
ncbi:uncharacterized protein [Argopecten irradians]|uniref:uncharacterized protein n=1 Tax=Argopecten irradians TaxID=31199 RepID=UPI003710E77B